MFDAIVKKVTADEVLAVEEIVFLLKVTQKDLASLYQLADTIRAEVMGDAIFLRGIVEFSNYCRKNCNYCGIRGANKEVHRYRIPDDAIIGACNQMKVSGQTTVVLQSGEDAYYTKERFGTLLARVKDETGLAITVSVGERDEETYRYWQEKGMDRYLLRIETSDKDLFNAMHPDDDFDERVKCLEILKKLGVQTGSGILIGLPEQTYEMLAKDILYITKLDLDMIGVGPFIAHEKTPLIAQENSFDTEVAFKVIAILRLLNKDAHIPSTTAFDALVPHGRNLLLKQGCNVFMPNATPQKYRKDYMLYPNKPCTDESAADCAHCVVGRISGLGRKVGVGPGHSIKQR